MNKTLQTLLCAAGIALVQHAAAYDAVTNERLLKPEPQNWLMYRGTYNGHGYSPLDKINTANVKRLVPVWSYSTGMVEGHQAPPIVNNGVMFISTPQNQVLALNAKTGEQIWQFQSGLNGGGAPAVSYEVDGEQYIAVQAGWGIDAQRMQAGIDALDAQPTYVPQGGTVMVFKLSK